MPHVVDDPLQYPGPLDTVQMPEAQASKMGGAVNNGSGEIPVDAHECEENSGGWLLDLGALGFREPRG